MVSRSPDRVGGPAGYVPGISNSFVPLTGLHRGWTFAGSGDPYEPRLAGARAARAAPGADADQRSGGSSGTEGGAGEDEAGRPGYDGVVRPEHQDALHRD